MRVQRRHPIRRLPLVLLAAVAAIAAGCLPGSDNANGGLVGTNWTVISIGGAPTLPDSPPTMIFAPEGLSGTTGCNSYGGAFKTDGDQFGVEPLLMTEMACDDPRSAQEAAFTQALSAATSWRQTEQGRLELQGGPIIVAEPRAAAEAPSDGSAATASPDEPITSETGLAGTSWTLVEIGDTADLARIVPTLAFGADGSAGGLAGCNTFNAAYELDGDALTFGSIGSTKMACGRPADAVESLYLSTLQAVTSWSIDEAGRLILEGDGGRLALSRG